MNLRLMRGSPDPGLGGTERSPLVVNRYLPRTISSVAGGAGRFSGLAWAKQSLAATRVASTSRTMLRSENVCRMVGGILGKALQHSQALPGARIVAGASGRDARRSIGGRARTELASITETRN